MSPVFLFASALIFVLFVEDVLVVIDRCASMGSLESLIATDGGQGCSVLHTSKRLYILLSDDFFGFFRTGTKYEFADRDECVWQIGLTLTPH